MKIFCILLAITAASCCYGQGKLNGFVIDSNTRNPLPFATVQTSDGKHSVISEMNGRFSLFIPGDYSYITVSFIGYTTKKVNVSELAKTDTILLVAAKTDLNEVVIYSNQDKIKRIINTAIRNKPLNNPDQYNHYECNIYYKMHMDMVGFEMIFGEPASKGNDTLSNTDSTKELRLSGEKNYVLFSETYSKRIYQKPQQVQDIVIASRFSGVKKTYFTSFVTDVLPFHAYNDYINISEKDYSNPVAKGWQQRYRFSLRDEFRLGKDTVFLMEFEPKTSNFNGLRGIIYINSNGYAISHFIGNSADTSSDRVVRMEHIYSFVNGKWFPKELNYNLTIRRVYNGQGQLQINGHSVIDSPAFDRKPSIAFDKAHSIRLSDSVDLHSSKEWEQFRPEPLSKKEAGTYVYVDSLSQALHLENKIVALSHLAYGRLPIGKFDLDVTRLLASNNYEGTRLGAGFYTNNHISKYYSLGGWVGYGLKDKQWKYGGSLTLYPNGKKENSLSFSFQQTYRNAGDYNIHPELNKTGLANWLLGKVDKMEQYKASASIRLGYWEMLPEISKSNLRPQYTDTFIAHGATNYYNANEAAVGIRYAYGEKRSPVFDYYQAYETKYPIIYFRVATGKITSAAYAVNYAQVLTAITYKHHINRWGNDIFRIEAGLIKTFQNQPLPFSFLLAGNGIRMKNINYYSNSGFLTMRPYDYYSDHFASLFYKHDIDHYFWNKKYSKPFLSLAHNLVYGSISAESKTANPNALTFTSGYHESGILINQLLRKNLHFADVNFTTGIFYHWSRNQVWKKNTVCVFAITMGF
jgi:hypothetical protein